jgi:hypothetical protein
MLIRTESRNCSRLYEELGKYYYNNLRSQDNERAKLICDEIENEESKLEAAARHLEEMYHEDELKADKKKAEAGGPVSENKAEDNEAAEDTADAADKSEEISKDSGNDKAENKPEESENGGNENAGDADNDSLPFA